ncbi:hypothetical protein LCGC14_0540280 [marine sediment metagenome]|uniref:Uncharacterized protein n=1 Tax=marine sediment metagenome TaxID=412755 RepID=A0A0F9UEG3_9ZZZZ
MFIAYNEIIVSSEDTIQKLANILSKLEIKSINKLVNEIELSKVLEMHLSNRELNFVLEMHLSNRELNFYYITKYKLKRLLNK